MAFLAASYPSVVSYSDPSAPEWPVVYVDTPQGQMSWHLSEYDLDLFTHVPLVTSDDPAVQWDGHTVGQKYDRLARLTDEVAATQ